MAQRITYIIFILTLFPLLAISQSRADSTTVDSIQNNRIGFAYGPRGMPSKSVRIIENLIQNNKFDSIRELIHSTNPSLKYLSIRICEHLEKIKTISLTTEELQTIEQAKKSIQKIEYRSGCTIRESVSLKYLFSNHKYQLNKELNYWIKENNK